MSLSPVHVRLQDEVEIDLGKESFVPGVVFDLTETHLSVGGPAVLITLRLDAYREAGGWRWCKDIPPSKVPLADLPPEKEVNPIRYAPRLQDVIREENIRLRQALEIACAGLVQAGSDLMSVYEKYPKKPVLEWAMEALQTERRARRLAKGDSAPAVEEDPERL